MSVAMKEKDFWGTVTSGSLTPDLPASRTRTLVLEFSESRLASVKPAVPPPTMI